jgi:hypothetical protein
MIFCYDYGRTKNRRALISAVRSTPNGRFTELEFKLRAAWRRALYQSDYRSVVADVG